LSPPLHSTLFPYTTLFRSRGYCLHLTETSTTLSPQRPRFAHCGRGKMTKASSASSKKSRLSIPIKDDDGLMTRCLPSSSYHDHKDRKSTRLNSSHVEISYA